MSRSETKPQIVSYSWADVEVFISGLVKKLQKYHFDAIIGIGRGGLIPAVLLSDELNLPLITIGVQNYKYGSTRAENKMELTGFAGVIKPFESYLVVDDVLESGDTLNLVLSELYEHSVTKIVIAVLVNKSRFLYSGDVKIFSSVKNSSGVWINFPWSAKEYGS